jgi:cell division protein FtsI/penicillin-binding protein 2
MTDKRSKRRTVFIYALIFLWCGVIFFRLYSVGIKEAERYQRRSRRQWERIVTLSPKRGVIYDRMGRELAVSVDVPSIYADPSKVFDPDYEAGKLAPILSMDKDWIKERLLRKGEFAWLKRKVSPRVAEEVRALKLRGIGIIYESKRFYPNGILACHILGFAGMDNIGLAGIERQYDELLRGSSGRILAMTRENTEGLISDGEVSLAPTVGRDLILSLDTVIQYYAERELEKAISDTSARGGMVIVIDPTTGDILALASRPGYDPNRFGSYPRHYFRNRAVSDAYEPGSTFKIVTAAVALEEGVVSPSDRFYCGRGAIVIDGYLIRDTASYEYLNFREVLEHSSNVGAVLIGTRNNPHSFYDRLKGFGFGKRTDIDLPGESPGLISGYKGWTRFMLGEISIGQGIGVTPLQMLRMAAAIANGGYLVSPRVALGKREGGRRFIPVAEGEKIRAVSPGTCSIIREIMEGVVERGTGRKAAVPGYRVAGKTGTAQKIGPSGSYADGGHIASFVGFAPAEKPRIAVIVVIDEPKGSYFGGQVAAPLFSRIVLPTLRYLRVPPERKGVKTLARMITADGRNY